MWREANLAFSDAVKAAECSVIAAHPWVYGLGQQTDNGAYLSPANAVGWLSARLAATGGTGEVVIFMVTGQTQEIFMNGLNALSDVFPAPAFTQVRRLAASAASLALEKMQIPARGTASLPPSVPLSVPTSRMAAAAAAISAAQGSSGGGIAQLKARLAEFSKARETMLADIAAGMGALKAKSARASVFTASGDLQGMPLQLGRDIPDMSAVHTVAMMMIGKNLEGIRSMIHEFKPDARP